MKRSGGYWSTSRMLLECAMCMIPENEKLLAEDPYASNCPAGAHPHVCCCCHNPLQFSLWCILDSNHEWKTESIKGMSMTIAN
jgi:hypothetical protein